LDSTLATPGSGAADLGIMSIETEDPSQMFKEFATSNHPWAIKFLLIANCSLRIV